MPLADATVYTTFKVQTINEVKITWNDGTEEEWGTLQSALNEIKSNASKQGKKITLLKYVYSRIETDIPEIKSIIPKIVETNNPIIETTIRKIIETNNPKFEVFFNYN
jgi:hypothetical protein